MLKSGRFGRIAQFSIRLSMAFAIELGAMPVSAKAPKSFASEVKITHFSIKGKMLKLLEFANRSGQVVRQELISPDFYEISLSRSGNGQMDSWERYTKDMSVRMRVPRLGHFVFMDVEAKKRDGILLMRFSRTHRGDYALYASSLRPYKKLGYSLTNDFVVGCRAHELPTQLLAAQMNDLLYNSPDSAVKFRDAIASQILEPNCNQPPFDKVKSDIVKAVYDVASSDTDFKGKDIQTLQGIKTKTKGKFLQCLRFYDLDAHASRISAAFAQYSDRAPAEPFKWKISCDAKAQGLGEFDNSIPDTPPIITLGRPALQVAPARIGDKQNLETAFAQTFFHEMLHYSLIADEDTTGAIEHCCATEDNENSASCKGVQAIVKLQNRSQIIEGEVAANLGDNYPLYRDTLRDLFGSIADQYIDKFYTETAAAYNLAEEKPNCLQPKTATLTPQCLAEFQSAFGDIVDREFGDSNNGQCVTTAAVKMGVDMATDLCSRLEMASRKIYGLPSTKLAGKDPCANRKFIRADENVAALFLPKAWADQFGSDPQNDYKPDGDAICKLANDANGYTYNFDGDNTDHSIAAGGPGAPGAPGTGVSAPTAVATQKSMASLQETTASANGTTATAKPQPDKGPTEIWTDAPKGPQVTDYSDSPSSRETQILSDLNRNNNLDHQLNSLSNKLVAQIIPQAVAQTNTASSFSPSYRQTAAVEDLTSGGGATMQAKSVQKVSATVNDPLAVPSGPPELANRGPTMNSFDSPKFSTTTGRSELQPASVAAADKNPSPSAAIAGAAARSATAGTLTGAATKQGAAPGSGSLSSTKGGATGGLGGGAAQGASASGAKDLADELNNKAFEQERKNFLKSLQRAWALVKPELDKTEMIQALTKYQIQVIDDQSRALGSGFPKTKMVYDKRVNRLVIDKSTRERNRQ